MEVTIKECMLGFMMLSGQICAASTRIYVEESFAPKFLEAFKAAVEVSTAQLVGDPNDRNKIIGTIVDAHQHKRVMSYIEKGKSEGKLLTGGEPLFDKVFRC